MVCCSWGRKQKFARLLDLLRHGKHVMRTCDVPVKLLLFLCWAMKISDIVWTLVKSDYDQLEFQILSGFF